MESEDIREAHRQLLNWGRWARDHWPLLELGYAPPPTSDGYIAPVAELYDPPPAQIPVDELAAIRSEGIIVLIGLDDIDSYRALVRWYTRLIWQETTLDECYKRLSKFMHCSYSGARRIHVRAVRIYSDRTTRRNQMSRYCRA